MVTPVTLDFICSAQSAGFRQLGSPMVTHEVTCNYVPSAAWSPVATRTS